jgi:hypothetical protein
MFCKKCLNLVESVKILKLHLETCKGVNTHKYNNISDIYESLQKSKNSELILTEDDYGKKIKLMMKERSNRLSEIGVLQYIELLKKDYNKILEFLKNKNSNKTQYKKIINTSFNTIEIKLLEIDQFYNIPTRIEDIKWWSDNLYEQNQNDVLTPFIKSKFLERLMNISLCFFPIEEILQKELINKNGYNNVIFVRCNELNFSFYFLDKIGGDGKNYWKMDCRLEDLINDVVDNLLFYCCIMFRKYYRCVFGDNDYRKNFIEINNFTECELNQLFQNILCLASMPKIYDCMQSIIMKNATYIPTSNDKFNLKTDDKIQLKKIENMLSGDWKTKVFEVVKELFDNDFDF